MILRQATYSEYDGGPLQWKFTDLPLRNINLFVSKNATGKSRTLLALSGLATRLINKPKVLIEHSQYDLQFWHDGVQIRYQVTLGKSGTVERERYSYYGDEKIARNADGSGTMYVEEAGKSLKLQLPNNELAVSRRDLEQYPYLTPIQEWADNLLYYDFGSDLGKPFVTAMSANFSTGQLDRTDTGQTVAVFNRGKENYPDEYEKQLIEDLNTLNFPVESITVGPPSNTVLEAQIGVSVVALKVKETGIDGSIDHMQLSRGMFRCLAVLAQINYYVLSSSPSCIIIDDIGEGLDFERSCAFVKLLIAKASQSNVQLIMASNDRFIMNAVPLEYWTILERQGGTVEFFNYDNSKKSFDGFERTGLNHFDLFAMGKMRRDED